LDKHIFSANPVLVSFGWRQYTPYFNDGEECTFSANTDYFDFTVRNADGGEEEEAQRAGKQVDDLLSLFTDDDFKLLFGDHVSVKVDSDGVTTESCDHD
jgi:hypothetical protein